jgi:hypothetical protein
VLRTKKLLSENICEGVTIKYAAALVFLCALDSSAPERATMTISYLACRSEATFSHAEALRRTADPEVAEEFVAKIILNGECIWLRAGIPLQIVRSAENPLYVIVLPIGETSTFVTYGRFLQK